MAGSFKIIPMQLESSFRGTAGFWMLFDTSVELGMSMLVASNVFAKMSEYMPWQLVAVCCVCLIAVSLILCAVILPRWISFKKS